MFANPVPGRIQAHEEPWDGTSFRVTSTFEQHVASGRGPGVDLGNGRCGAEVYASEAGKITEAFRDPGNNALIVRIDHGNGLVTGYAHLDAIEVGLVPVTRGQLIGHVGATGATACHLHWGVNRNGVEIDGWPLLDQNIAGGDMNLKGTPVQPIQNRKTTLKAGGTFVADPTAMPYQVITAYQPGQLFVPTYLVKGNSILGTDQWYGGFEPFQRAGQPITFGYLSAALCNELSPIEAAGATPAQVQKAVTDATASLQQRITDIKAKVAAGAVDVADD